MLTDATGGQPPTVFDPFCEGGSTLVEAQRLGLPAAGSDLTRCPCSSPGCLPSCCPGWPGVRRRWLGRKHAENIHPADHSGRSWEIASSHVAVKVGYLSPTGSVAAVASRRS